MEIILSGTNSQKEMNNQIGPLHNYLGFFINTTAYNLGQYSINLLLIKGSMADFSMGHPRPLFSNNNFKEHTIDVS